MPRTYNGACAGTALVLAITAPLFSSQVYRDNLPADHPSIQYLQRAVDDPVHRLAASINRGEIRLRPQQDAEAYVPELLQRLEINTNSQMLVFSKTSLQAAHISPDRPRALYFNDTAVVAYVPGATAVELVATDPRQGPIFYAVTVDAGGTPSFARSGTCLHCHQGPNTEGVPGIYVGSVVPGPTGAPRRGDSAIITDHRTPFADRWGGWYVTSRRGEQPDRANAVASNPADPDTLIRESQQNLVSLAGRVRTADYLAPTSDIVALMVFEHQTQMTNLLTRVGWEWRIRGQASAVDDVVKYMLFKDEASLKEPIEGVSTFTQTFPLRGPRDRRGRSLRDFDLRTRIFRYPLTYMVYSEAFDALPGPLRAEIYQRLHDVLAADRPTAGYDHLTAADRKAILEIIRETKPNLPRYWRAPAKRTGRR